MDEEHTKIENLLLQNHKLMLEIVKLEGKLVDKNLELQYQST
jgi:hypothetical protein